MPNFSDKITPEQRKDIAAFVGAQDASGKAVAKPFEPNDVKLEDCKPNDWECYEQGYGNMVYNDGPKPALAKLDAALRSDAAVQANCHRIAHRMGSAGLARYKDNVAKAFVAGSPTCASGYYHGITERAFLGTPDDQLASVASDMCQDPSIENDRFLFYQCLHGLGHGLMIYTGYELPLSLKTCDQLRDEFSQVSCTGGAFMENFNSSYGIRSKYLRTNDLIYPCKSVAERHKLYCYLLVSSRILQGVGYDFKKTAQWCHRSEPRWVQTCFESFGRDVSGTARTDHRRMLSMCRFAKANEGDCIYGAVRDIVNTDAKADRGGRFCAGVPNRYRDRCYQGVGSIIASLEASKGAQTATCRRVSGRYANACLVGAGLRAA
jgi:hypothetical protein